MSIAAADNPEIAVVGDGPVGLMAALALADAGRETVLVAPSWNDTARTGDARTAAILGGGIEFLEDLRVWSQLMPVCAPLRRLRIVNAKPGPALLRRGDCSFDAAEIGRTEFGWNVPVAALKAALMEAASERPHLRVLARRKVRRLVPTSTGYRLELDNGASLGGAAIIAADGRGSRLRREAGIEAEDVDLDQSAIVTSFDHARPHAGTSIELHREGGPFTTVPLPGRRSSLVWVMPHEAAKRLAAMPPGRFFARLDHVVQPWLGRIDQVTPPERWPLRRVLASNLAHQNLLLIGETAHAFSPIGAQGLNLSIRDIISVRTLVEALEPPDRQPFDMDAAIELGRRYSRRRVIDVQTRSFAVRMLNEFVANRTMMSGNLEELGLQFFKSAPILRKAAMQSLMPPRISTIWLP